MKRESRGSVWCLNFVRESKYKFLEASMIIKANDRFSKLYKGRGLSHWGDLILDVVL